MSDIGARIRELSDLFGPPGREGAVRAYLRAALAGAPCEVEEDPVGNLYATRAGAAEGPRVMILAPMDEPGLVVTHLDDHGRAAVAALGPLTAVAAAGARVVLPSGAVAAVGLRRAAEDEERLPTFERLYLDFGVRSRQEAATLAAVGDPAVPDVRAAVLPGGQVCGKALGTRAACAAGLMLLTETAAVPAAAATVTVAFVAQSEVGHRGVRPAVRRMPADLLISIGPAAATDTPKARGSEVRLGGGPVLMVSDRGLLASASAVDALTAAAERAGLALQVAVADPGTASAGPALIAAAGAPAGGIAFPLRHRHTSAEICDPADVAASAQVLAALFTQGRA